LKIENNHITMQRKNPVRDDRLVEPGMSDPHTPRLVRDGRRVETKTHNITHSVPDGTGDTMMIRIFYQHIVPDGTLATRFRPVRDGRLVETEFRRIKGKAYSTASNFQFSTFN
jgi:hypothetical protein